MAHGLTKAESEILGDYRNEFYAVCDGSISIHERHAATPDVKDPVRLGAIIRNGAKNGARQLR